MLQDSIIVKTNFYGDFRRFTVEKEVEYVPFVNMLQTLYDDKSLCPPYTHTLKYVDEDGDSITVVTSNDLKLAISYSSKLTRPILRLSVEKKVGQQTTSQTPISLSVQNSTATTPSTTIPVVPFPTLKIEGRSVQLPAEIKERYGPKKDPLPSIAMENYLVANNNNNINTVSTETDNNNNKTFSCQDFSAETRKKNTENSIIITSSQKELGERTAKEIDDFASDISKTFKNIAANSNLTAVRRGSAERHALAESSSFQSLSPSNLTFPENGFDVTESTIAKFKGLSLSTIDEQAKEIDAIKEHHLIESGIMMKKAKDLHDSTVNLVVREASNFI